MKPFRTTIRVQYSDTDKMMVVYHANYLKYFQTARTEYFREAGFPYSDMEKDDFQMNDILKPANDKIKPANDIIRTRERYS